ncbi:DUF2798 domain-containing protein [Jannaschia ovalis]|uniref:DUF2798 domain-containing protein n=1 Tax=Jannaschia ovalis TaxID=3038773 RepID=A0ABY8LJ20_9RHOB|nr:DUF2798 domain-containing protein [Jannaschia sp. GRR-S6-38]WGH80113.1 DUF2798 domain-containing protein [Jannaschia sp. GRR-S6-38]
MTAARYAPIPFGFILSGLISRLVSGIAAGRAAGTAEGMLELWMRNRAMATPALRIVAQIAPRRAARLVRAA